MVLIPGVPKTGPRPSVPHPEAVGSQQVASYICFSVTHLVADLYAEAPFRAKSLDLSLGLGRRLGCLDTIDSRMVRRRSTAWTLIVLWPR